MARERSPAIRAGAQRGEEARDRAIRVVVADDSYLVREAITHVLDSDPRIEIVATCEDGVELLAAVETESPDVVLTDIRMPPSGDDEGIRIANRLRETHGEIGVVVMSQYADPRYGVALLERGSDGRAYLLKERLHDPRQLVAAVLAVAEGGSIVDTKVVEAGRNRSGEGRPVVEWLGGSQMASAIAHFDWTRTPLGPLEAWPAALRSAVSICLRSRFQMAIYWGPDLNCIYNDAEREVLGRLHPGALGLPARRLLRDSWDIVGPQLRSVMRTGVATWSEDQELVFNRHGRPEPGYFTYSYSPLADGQGGIGGVLLVTQDTTARVLAERRAEARRNQEHESSERALRSLLAELRAAQRRGAAARDAERRRIERNLHDGAQQRLVAIQVTLGAIAERLQSDPAAARDELELVQSDLSDALYELRELAHGVYPPLLATDGLVAALEAIARHASLPTRVTAGAIGRLPSEIEAAAYFCCLEALQNAGKHAGENARASIHIERTDEALRFSVEDDGVGFNVDDATEGDGLVNLRDRVLQFGGGADIASAPNRGTRVWGEIPLH